MENICSDTGAACADLGRAARTHDKGRKGPRVFSYKLALAAIDLSAVLGAALISLWMQRKAGDTGIPVFQEALFLCFYLIPMAFFTNFRLYSYHLIFSPRYHLASLGKACLLALVAIGTIGLTYRWPEFMPWDFFVPAVVGFALLVLVASHIARQRYSEQNITVLLKAIGLAFVLVGLIGIAGPRDPSIILLRFSELMMGVSAAACVLVLTRCLMVHLIFNIYLRRHFRR